MNRVTILIFAIVLLNSCGGESGTTSNTSKKVIVKEIESIPKSRIDEYKDAINSAREQGQTCGSYGYFAPAKPLKWNNKLYNAAYEHSRDIALYGVLEHDGTNSDSDWTAYDLNLNRGSKFYERIENSGYDSYKLVAENVAAGTYMISAKDAVDAWIKSPGHCKTLMNANLKEFGLAHVKKETKYINYWTLDLGER